MRTFITMSVFISLHIMETNGIDLEIENSSTLLIIWWGLGALMCIIQDLKELFK